MIVSDKYCLALFRLAVAERAGWKCEICGHSGDDCQAHHIYSRDNKSVRYDPDNGLWVCNVHHRWAEEMGVRFVVEFLCNTRTRTDRWREKLATKKNTTVKCNGLYRLEWTDRLLNEIKGKAA